MNVCSDFRNRRNKDDGIDVPEEEIEYFQLDYPEFKYMNIVVGDTWLGADKPNTEKTLKDSPNRNLPVKKNYKQRAEELEELVKQLSKRIEILEK